MLTTSAFSTVSRGRDGMYVRKNFEGDEVPRASSEGYLGRELSREITVEFRGIHQTIEGTMKLKAHHERSRAATNERENRTATRV